MDKNPNVGEISLENENLIHNSNLEVFVKLDKKNSKHVALNSDISVLDPVNGRKSFPIIGPSSLVHVLDTVNGRQTFPITDTALSLGDVRDSIFHDDLTLQPIISPITTIISPITTNDEILGQDKRKVHLTTGPKNLSAACLNDGKILSKYWGKRTLILLMAHWNLILTLRLI